MAKTVSEMPGPYWRGGARKYPWDQWLNGDVWCLRRGEDFQSRPINMGCAARAAGQRRGLQVIAHIHGDELYLQARPRAQRHDHPG